MRPFSKRDCGRLDPDVVIRPELGEWHPRMPDRLALTVGARLAVSDN
jgi:hypothetical protein